MHWLVGDRRGDFAFLWMLERTENSVMLSTWLSTLQHKCIDHNIPKTYLLCMQMLYNVGNQAAAHFYHYQFLLTIS